MIRLIPLFFLLACDNVITRQYGGNTDLKLPCGQKLVTATWKEADIWYLTRPMHETETAETYVFQESSVYGVLEGTVAIVECR